MKIIDLHTHILPGIDDGAADMAEAMEMLRNAVASDVKAVVVTPHCNVPGFCENHYTPEFLTLLRRLRTGAVEAGIPIHILAGMEVRANDGLLTLLRQGKLLTLNGSRYLLTEFAADASPGYCTGMLRKLLDMGYTPVVAHPERCAAMWEDPGCADDWLALGCQLQLTGGSILGKFGYEAKRAADHLLSRNMAACIASDAHGSTRRTNFLADVYDYISLHYSPDTARRLFWENPLRICQNEPL